MTNAAHFSPSLTASSDRNRSTQALSIRNPESETRDPVELPAGRAFSIRETSGITHVRVETGKIWLTATPGTEDIVLQAGDLFTFTQDWPFVLETLSDARIILN
ncbi:MAG TPA: DUF2917 domain-containing protein [Chthoniobacterales bacterium]